MEYLHSSDNGPRRKRQRTDNNAFLSQASALTIQPRSVDLSRPTPAASDIVEFLIQNDVLRQDIVSRFDVKAFLNLAASCKTLRKALLAERFDVNTRLKRFFPDPIAFRQVQADTGTLISGDFALQVFDDVTWRDYTLDLLVCEDDCAKLESSIVDQGWQHHDAVKVPKIMFDMVRRVGPEHSVWSAGSPGNIFVRS